MTRIEGTAPTGVRAPLRVASPYAVSRESAAPPPVDTLPSPPAAAIADETSAPPAGKRLLLAGLTMLTVVTGLVHPTVAAAMQSAPDVQQSVTMARDTSTKTTSHAAKTTAPALAKLPPAAPADATAVKTADSPPVIVVIGDSISAGTEDAITDAVRQDHSFGSQLAADLGIPFNNPEIGGRGIPPGVFVQGRFNVDSYLREIHELTDAAKPVAIHMAFLGMPSENSLHRIWNAPGMGQRTPESRNTPTHPQDNFAVSGYELRHLTDVHGVNDYVHEIMIGAEGPAGLVSETPLIHAQLQNGTDQAQGSAVGQAIARHPDLTIAWGGNNDALGAIFGGVVDDRTLTPVLDQPWNYWTTNPVNHDWYMTHTSGQVKGFLHAFSAPDGLIDQLLKGTQGQIITMTIPSVTSVPYLRDVGQPVGTVPFHMVLKDGTDVTQKFEQMVIPDKIVGHGKDGRKVFPPGSRVGLLALLSALTTTADGREVQTAADFDQRLREIQAHGVFSEFDVLDPDEVAQIQARIDQYNDIIEKKAAENPRVHVIDMNAVFRQLLENGRHLRGAGPDVVVTGTFTGEKDARGYEGIFSFDGVHPSFVGHAIIANLVLDEIKTDLKDDPKFAQYQNAPYIDEKAVLRSDPHYNGQWSVVLDPTVIQRLAQESGVPLGAPGHSQVSEPSAFPLPIPVPSLPLPIPSLPTIPDTPGAPDSGASLFDIPTDAPAPGVPNTPHENWGLRMAPQYHVGAEARTGKSAGFGVTDAGVSQTTTFDYEAGPWENHTHLTGSLETQIGTVHDATDRRDGANGAAGLRLDDTVRRQLSAGLGLDLNADVGVQGGVGQTFDHQHPLNRFDVGGSLLIDKSLGAGSAYAGPFVRRVVDFTGADTRTDLGLRTGYGLQVDPQDQMQIEGRVWNANYARRGTETDYGAYLQINHQIGGQKKVTLSPFVGYEKRNGENQAVGGIQARF